MLQGRSRCQDGVKHARSLLEEVLVRENEEGGKESHQSSYWCKSDSKWRRKVRKEGTLDESIVVLRKFNWDLRSSWAKVAYHRNFSSSKIRATLVYACGALYWEQSVRSTASVQSDGFQSAAAGAESVIFPWSQRSERLILIASHGHLWL